MSIKPILFNTDMVRAILENRKTATRRLVSQRDLQVLDSPYSREHPETPAKVLLEKLCGPPCQPDDILYVREAWAQLPDLFDERPGYVYLADLPQCDLDELKRKKFRWRPSIHMPRKAARIFLRVTDVRVERLRKITIEGMRMEGVVRRGLLGGCTCAWKTETCMREPCPSRDAYEYECWVLPFIKVWNGTIKKTDRALYGWDANPWVWVIEFERISREEVMSNA